MGGIYTGLAVWNLIVLTGFAVLGAVRAQHGDVVDIRTYQILALFAAVFCCLVHSILVAHFIGTMKWIQQSGPTAGIDDTKKLRTRWIKGPAFPTLVCAMLLAVAAAILAGGSDMGSTPYWVHLVLAFAGIPLNVVALVFARRAIAENHERIHGLDAQMHARIRQGLVTTDDADKLRPESGRAGGKVFIFLSINVWVLYGYMRFVLRDPSEPWLPYVIASAVLVIVGYGMLRSNPQTDEPPTPDRS